MNDSQKKKRNFRQSKKWKELRHRIHVKQEGRDPITNKKLLKGANLHHKNLDEREYENLSNEEWFVYLNKATHDVVHFLYRYYVNDKDIINRLTNLLDEMIKINKGEYRK